MLAPKENVLAALQVDLSAALRFAAGWVVVTSERLMACDPGTTAWRSWPLADGLALKLHDHGGVGSLELHNAQERVALWRFTLAHHAQALTSGVWTSPTSGAVSAMSTHLSAFSVSGMPATSCSEHRIRQRSITLSAH